MKTPRDILLARHQTAKTKLDAIRKNVVADLSVVGTQERDDISIPEYISTSLRGWLLSLRWHLTGLSAAWLLIAILNVDSSSPEIATVATAIRPSAQEVVKDLQANRRQIAELVEPRIEEPVLMPPRRSQLFAPNRINIIA